jgi:hypothetical protein
MCINEANYFIAKYLPYIVAYPMCPNMHNSLLHFFSYIYNEFTFFAWHYKSKSFDILWNTHKIHYIDLKFECIFIVIHCTCITHLQNFGIKTFGFLDFEPYLQSFLIFPLFWAFNKNGLKKDVCILGIWMLIMLPIAFTFECNNIWHDVLQRLNKWYCWMQQYLTWCIAKA